jgi:hypothetical protein
VWGKRPEDLTLTYLYLATGEEVSHRMEDPEAVRGRVSAWLETIASDIYEPAPGEHCRWCDFRPFCEPGRSWVQADPGAEDGLTRPTT